MSTGNYLGSTQGAQVNGTTTNDNADAGDVGQTVSSAATAVALPTSGNWGDLTSISLTAGDWLVSLVSRIRNAAASTIVTYQVGISTTTGNSSTGLTFGDNEVDTDVPVATQQAALTIPSYRMSLSATTTVYLKMLAVYSTGTNQIDGRLSAVRIR